MAEKDLEDPHTDTKTHLYSEFKPNTVVVATDYICRGSLPTYHLNVYRGEVVYLIEQQPNGIESGEWKAKTDTSYGYISDSVLRNIDINSLRAVSKIVTTDWLPYCLSGTFFAYLVETREAHFVYNNYGTILQAKLDLTGLSSDEEILDRLQTFMWKNRNIFRFYIDDDSAVYCNQFLNSNRHISKNGTRYPYIPNWYYGYFGKAPTRRVLDRKPVGSFIVGKDRPQQRFVLSVTDGTTIYHIPIEEKDGQVAFPNTVKKYASVVDLVEHSFVIPLFLETDDELTEVRLERWISRHDKDVPDGFSTLDPYWTELYLHTLLEGTEKQTSVRVMIVGHEHVGKTTLARNLMDTSREGIVSTDGIEVHIDTCIVEDSGTWTKSNGDSDMLERIVKVMQINNKTDRGSSLTSSSQSDTENEPVGTKLLSDTSPTHNTDHNTGTKSLNNTGIDTNKTIATDHVASRKPTELPQQITDAIAKQDGVVLSVENARKLMTFSTSVDESVDKTVSIWDFGGQYVYYATHQLFHSPRAVYLLVLDLAKPLNDVVDFGNPLGGNGGMKRDVQTFIKFWMHSIHAFVGSETGEPPVILVGTHKDKIEELGKSSEEHSETYFDDVRLLFDDAPPLLYHIQPEQFFVDNLTPDKASLDELKSSIMSIAARQPFWNQEFPAKWVTLEFALKHVSKPYVTFSQVCELNSRSEVPIEEDEVRLFLMYHHFQGSVVYFNENDLKDFVVLDPQWLIDAFKSIITSRRFCKVRAHLRKLWHDFEETAMLKNALIEEVWQLGGDDDFFSNRHIILKFLVRLGIMSMCKSFSDDTEEIDELDCYLVPSLRPLLQSEQTIDSIIGNATSTELVLVFRVESAYISPTIFHRTTAAAMGRWAVMQRCGTHILYGNVAMYRLDMHHIGLTRLTDTTIELSVYNLNEVPVKGELADYFRRFLSKIINHELNRFHSQYVPRYETVLRCACANKGCCEYMAIDDLQSADRLPCLQSAQIHHIDCKKAYREWYVDAETLVKQVEDGANVRKTTLGDADIGELAKAVGLNWKLLGISLGVSTVQLERIQMDNPYSSVVQIRRMLQEWKRLAGDAATIETLVTEMKANPAVTIDWDVVKDVMDTCDTEVKKVW